MDKGLSSAQRSFLKDVTEQEKRLKSLKNDTITYAVEILGLQEELREKYQKLIIQHPSFGSSVTCKEVEEKLWKLCFYVKIEEYRKSIRKTVMLRDGQEGTNSTPGAANLGVKARTHLAKLISAFTKFLSDGTSFYQDFMLKLEASYKMNDVAHHAPTATEPGNNFVQCIFRCLMYLGDLARYRELYCDNKEKDYSEAGRYYERASFLSNTSGHPHNQLAVLSSYSDMDCLAVYHYSRSVMILKPFASGFDNLGLIFDKNLKAYSALREESPSPDADAEGASASASAKDKRIFLAARAESFFVRFVRLHGDLFKWTQATSKAITDLQKAASAGMTQEHDDIYKAEYFDAPRCMSLIQKILSDFEFFMRYDESSVFSEILLVRLLTISLFSVHNAASLLGDKAPSEPLDCSVTESLALYFLFNFISRCATLFGLIPSSGSKMIESNVRRVLPVLTVFADWCCLHPRYLGFSSLGRDGKYNKKGRTPDGDLARVFSAESVRASEEVLRFEEEARGSVKSCITFLESFVKSSVTSSGGAAAHSTGRGSKHHEQRPPLREDIELRGFLPLKRSINVWSSDLKGLTIAQPIAVPEELARNRRLKDLLAFIEKLKMSPKSPLLKPQPSNGNQSERGSRDVNGKKGRREESPKANRDPKAGLLSISPGVITAAKAKEKEREKNIERFYTKMGDLREEMRDKNGKKGRREESPKGDRDRREQRAGLLTVAPGVLTAARQKEKDRERSMEQSPRMRGERGERRPHGKLVDTRTGGKTTRDRDRDREGRGSKVTSSEVHAMQGTEEIPTTATRNQRTKEEFPPLPGAKEPHSLASTINYAASALFSSSAPADVDPFDEDSSEEDSNFDENSDSEDDEDEAGLDAFNVGDAEEAGDGERAQSHMAYGEGLWDMGGITAAPLAPPALLQSSVTASGVFGGLFSGLGSSSTGSLFTEYAGGAVDFMPAASVTQSVPYDDDDFADDVVVFRPAFSRINAGPAPPSAPLAFGSDAGHTPLQPFLMNGRISSSSLSDLGAQSNQNRPIAHGAGGVSTYGNNFTGSTQAPRAPETWQAWDRAVPPYMTGAIDNGGYAPLPIPMGSMVFSESSVYTAQNDSSQGSHSPGRVLSAPDNWWAGSSSDIPTAIMGLPVRQDTLGMGLGLGESEYVSSRGMRGPPALQHAPPVSMPQRWAGPGPGGLSYSMPSLPPGLVPPPPGFASNGNNNSVQPYPLQRDGCGDSWTANPFYRSNG